MKFEISFIILLTNRLHFEIKVHLKVIQVQINMFYSYEYSKSEEFLWELRGILIYED